MGHVGAHKKVQADLKPITGAEPDNADPDNAQDVDPVFTLDHVLYDFCQILYRDISTTFYEDDVAAQDPRVQALLSKFVAIARYRGVTSTMVVLDGRPSAEKSFVGKKREKSRRKASNMLLRNQQIAADLAAQTQVGLDAQVELDAQVGRLLSDEEVRNLKLQAFKFTAQHASVLMAAAAQRADLEDFEFIVAPYEADVEIGRLAARLGGNNLPISIGVVSHDSDFFFFKNVKCLIRPFDEGHKVVYIRDFAAALKVPVSYLPVLGGLTTCDYTHGLPNLGLVRVAEIIGAPPFLTQRQLRDPVFILSWFLKRTEHYCRHWLSPPNPKRSERALLNKSLNIYLRFEETPAAAISPPAFARVTAPRVKSVFVQRKGDDHPWTRNSFIPSGALRFREIENGFDIDALPMEIEEAEELDTKEDLVEVDDRLVAKFEAKKPYKRTVKPRAAPKQPHYDADAQYVNSLKSYLLYSYLLYSVGLPICTSPTKREKERRATAISIQRPKTCI